MMYERFNMLARTYLDHQHLRVACEHRMMKIFKKLLGKEDSEGSPDKTGNYEGLLKEYKRLVSEKKAEADQVVEVLEKYRDGIHKEEKDILKSAVKMMKDEKLYEFCKRVRGLGPVALMTFLGFWGVCATHAGTITTLLPRLYRSSQGELSRMRLQIPRIHAYVQAQERGKRRIQPGGEGAIGGEGKAREGTEP
jgi:hypothetical protein